MSAKWQRSKQWDDEFFPAWAWPARALLRAFSSITLAVCLLSCIALYAILASVPIGLIAQLPTVVVYGLTLLVAVGVLAVLPVAIAWRVARKSLGIERRTCFAGTTLLLLVLATLAAWLWATFIWPELRFEPATGRGLRLFAPFCERYKATTLRRLPGLEMSELEFYSWWPLRIVLLAFVLNMVTATVRRIEFVFVNLGVLTVHTGIVTIALGSLYYKGLKLEGDVLLLAGEPGPDGTPTPGPLVQNFYDNTRVALWVNQRGLWEQRPLEAVPRYNDYNLALGLGTTAREAVGRTEARPAQERTLDLLVPPAPTPKTDQPHRVDPDVRVRVVGYASYAAADAVRDWLRAEPPAAGAAANPVRFVELHAQLPEDAAPKPALRFFLVPTRPAERIALSQLFALEYTSGMSAQRWADLTGPLPGGGDDEASAGGALHAIIVEVPDPAGGPGYKAVYPAEPGSAIDIGASGYRVAVEDVLPQPPLQIITEGYRGATSSVAIVRVTPPTGPAFTRYVYHRFPEINQDLLDTVNDRGMPTRRDADPAIRIAYVDASLVQVYLDEREDGSVRAAVRLPGGPATVTERIEPGGVLEEFITRRDPATDPRIDLVLTDRWEHAEPVERPRSVPESERQNEDVGTHARAMMAVEVSVSPANGPEARAPGSANWSRVVWLPFTRYLGVGLDTERKVTLPDGREITLAFGRVAHRLPGFRIQLVDFQAVKYEHRGAERDYQSLVRVIPDGIDFTLYEHVTKLNAPLQAPFMWNEEEYSWFGNAARTLASRLNPGQFKFSQSGWDRQTWEQSQAAVDRGEIARPFVSFTILGVGNNPGIHVIAAGGVLMSLGIPWAFYVKPWILKRRKRRLQAELAAKGLADAARATPRPLPVGLS
ncbi:MAG: hypothetical protein ACKVU4_04515 [Phycisphaerales bacterium]